MESYDDEGVNDPGPVEVFHGSTGHGEPPVHPERLVSFRALDPANRPRPFKVYPDLEPVLLPRRILRSSCPASEVLSGGRGLPAELGDELLGTLLFLAAGVTRFTGRGDERVWFRAAMSAGNLHPVEVYVVRAGVHHYQPLEHALVALRRPEELPQAGPGAAVVLIRDSVPDLLEVRRAGLAPPVVGRWHDPGQPVGRGQRPRLSPGLLK